MDESSRFGCFHFIHRNIVPSFVLLAQIRVKPPNFELLRRELFWRYGSVAHVEENCFLSVRSRMTRSNFTVSAVGQNIFLATNSENR